MRIVHIITRLIVGGAQENTLLTCEGLHARGHDVTLISGRTTGPEGSLRDRAASGGYRLLELPDLIRAVNPWRDARAERELESVLRDLAPDVVHTHSSKAGILGRRAAVRARTPIIIHTIHGMSFNRTQPWLVRTGYAWLERRCARFTDRLITVADALIDQSVAARIAPRTRFQTIYSGVQVDGFDPARYDRDAVRRAWGIGPGDDAIVVGTIARLFRNKGYEQLIPALARAAQRDPRLRFVWVGDGAQRGEYERRLAEVGLRERTSLTGLLPPPRIPEMLAGFDILAHGSQWEGLPRAAVQALLMRVPVVAFAIDGTPEVVINDQTGYCVPLNDLDALGEAVLRLARDAEMRRRMGDKGREMCLERFDARRMVDQIEATYHELAARRRARAKAV